MKLLLLVFLLVAMAAGQTRLAAGQGRVAPLSDAQMKVAELQKKMEDLKTRAEMADARAAEAEQVLKAEVAARRKAEAQAARGWVYEASKDFLIPLLSPSIAVAALLLFAGFSGLTGFAERMRFGRKTAWIAGAISGLFGGMVGNQGGIRSAALLGFDISKESFVATATAIGLIVDGARMPVYLATQHSGISRAWIEILVATIGVLIGTVWGVRLLRKIPELAFRRSIGALVFMLGLYMLVRGIREVR